MLPAKGKKIEENWVIPAEICYTVLQYLNRAQLAKTARVCKKWQKFADDITASTNKEFLKAVAQNNLNKANRIRYFLERVDINTQDEFGNNALHLLVGETYESGEVSDTSEYLAARNKFMQQNKEHVGFLNKLKPITLYRLVTGNYCKFRPSSHIPEDLDLVKLFIKHGIDVNKRNTLGFTPLHILAFGISASEDEKEIELVNNFMRTLIIEGGALHTIQNVQGMTPLDFNKMSMMADIAGCITQAYTERKSKEEAEARQKTEEKSLENEEEAPQTIIRLKHA